ncbi:hypothetical protein CathTA2_0247 [Caldalkalibacillus thermarum TA2.A1]|uniref:VOC family protein n=1 Tax=Caldalkalibacillus thermarum (strain TA2.A1) TaxID=986075 RepID=F5L385_CALTT|nr:VOC family protein [Caldalkalibacillus thermarum]EGL84202.1 hypothetical protein CathTA2_0247 [Caldalkalibacillus thermarum TA2.A1]QZT32505.1 VOC family protein [Caldalkalibacillus thermarum TA2.A1]
MELRETGIILFVENYEEALAFYTQKLGLPLRKKGESLSILEFGGSYLMIEKGGVAS